MIWLVRHEDASGVYKSSHASEREANDYALKIIRYDLDGLDESDDSDEVAEIRALAKANDPSAIADWNSLGGGRIEIDAVHAPRRTR